MIFLEKKVGFLGHKDIDMIGFGLHRFFDSQTFVAGLVGSQVNKFYPPGIQFGISERETLCERRGKTKKILVLRIFLFQNIYSGVPIRAANEFMDMASL